MLYTTIASTALTAALWPWTEASYWNSVIDAILLGGALFFSLLTLREGK